MIIWVTTQPLDSVVHVLVLYSEFYFSSSFLLGRDRNFQLVLVTKSQKGY